MAGSEALETTLDILTIAGYSTLNDRKGESRFAGGCAACYSSEL